MEVTVTVVAADLGGVVPAILARRVALPSTGVGDVQLPGEVNHDTRWDFGQVGQEGAQESYGPQLHREPEARGIAPAAGDEAAIRVVEVEVALQLGGRRFARIAAIAPLLLPGQEVDWHPRLSLQSSLRLGAECQIGSPRATPSRTQEIIGFRESTSCDKMGKP